MANTKQVKKLPKTSTKQSVKIENVETVEAAPAKQEELAVVTPVMIPVVQTTTPVIVPDVTLETTTTSKAKKDKPVAKKTKPVAKKGKAKSKTIKKSKSKAKVKTVKKSNKSVKKTSEHPAKVREFVPSTLDTNGLAIAGSRVKAVLVSVLNEEENRVRRAIMKAENKPVTPKPTKENPNPTTPPQGAQTPVDKLPKDILEYLQRAEQEHEENLHSAFEKHVVASMSDEIRSAYNVALAQAKANAEVSNQEFNVRAFNASYNASFNQAAYQEYKNLNDTLSMNKTKKSADGEVIKYNQWTRAMALVGKNCVRLSENARYILASFLDNLMLQCAMYSIENCVTSKLHTINAYHLLPKLSNYKETAPLFRFILTLDNYERAVEWYHKCLEVKARNKSILDSDKHLAKPELFDPKYDYNFESYITEVCKSAKMQFVESKKSAEEKQYYQNLKVSSEYRALCSYIIYETIIRVGTMLKNYVNNLKVKTIKENIMYFILDQVLTSHGISFTETRQFIESHLVTYQVYKDLKKNVKNEKKDMPTDSKKEALETVEESDEEDGDDEDGDEVEVEDGDEVEVDEEDDEIKYDEEPEQEPEPTPTPVKAKKSKK